MCKVSVIVPVYQVEAYLPRCLDSILSQTMRDFELILIDDGTRDNCPAIMREYAARDGRIRLIHKENGGLSSARNAGLKIARGEYIAFIDSDDYVEPSLLHDTVALADETGAQMVVFNYALADEQGGAYGAYLSMQDEVIDLQKLGLESYFYRYWLPYRHGQEAWSKLWRRDVIAQNALCFQPNDEIFAEDTLFTAMYLMHTRVIAAKNAVYVHYLQRENSIMGRQKPRMFERLTTLAIRFCDYARDCGKGQELKNVLPVLCYDKLICKGIRMDEDLQEVCEAMASLCQNETLRHMLWRLISPMPLLMYMLRTGKGFRSQITARLFAALWLGGRFEAAARLVRGREEHA